MLEWAVGQVVRCVNRDNGVQEATVRLTESRREEQAIHYTDTMRPLEAGDTVLLNVTSVQLRLGSGGYHFVYAILSEPWHCASRDAAGGAAAGRAKEGEPRTGHVMKLRYTPMQRAVLAVEEESSPHHKQFGESAALHGLPVLIGELHSMLPVAVCWLRQYAHESRPLNIAYIMTDGGALPLAWSRHVRLLKHIGWLQGTVTYGHAYGGDWEAVNKFTALLAAKHVLDADAAIVTMGPGIAGTGTAFGHTAMEVGEIVNAVAALGGIPVVMPRISFADSRPRHSGVSHHLLSALRAAALRPPVLPVADSLSEPHKQTIVRQLQSVRRAGGLPESAFDLRWVPGVTPRLVAARLAEYPETVTTMGRTVNEDAPFFVSVCAAAEYVSHLLRNGTGIRPAARTI